MCEPRYKCLPITDVKLIEASWDMPEDCTGVMGITGIDESVFSGETDG